MPNLKIWILFPVLWKSSEWPWNICGSIFVTLKRTQYIKEQIHASSILERVLTWEPLTSWSHSLLCHRELNFFKTWFLTLKWSTTKSSFSSLLNSYSSTKLNKMNLLWEWMHCGIRKNCLKYLPIKIICFQHSKTLVFHFYFLYLPLCSQVNIVLMVKVVLICLFLTSVGLILGAEL